MLYPDYGCGILLNDSVPDYLVGKLLTLIESFGLKESQEKAAKDLIKQTVYNEFRDNQKWIPRLVNSHLIQFIEDLNEAIKKKSPRSVPISIPETLEVEFKFKL
jgi:hypothetical protein